MAKKMTACRFTVTLCANSRKIIILGHQNIISIIQQKVCWQVKLLKASIKYNLGSQRVTVKSTCRLLFWYGLLFRLFTFSKPFKHFLTSCFFNPQIIFISNVLTMSLLFRKQTWPQVLSLSLLNARKPSILANPSWTLPCRWSYVSPRRKNPICSDF